METYVLHTKTNRYIKKNGTLYQKLKQEGVQFDTKRNIKKKKIFEPVLDQSVSKKSRSVNHLLWIVPRHHGDNGNHRQRPIVNFFTKHVVMTVF